MTDDELALIYENKKKFHKNQAKLPFEEKIKIVIELQKRCIEMAKYNATKDSNIFRWVWKIT